MPRSPEPARRQILDAALQLFATNGISGTSLRDAKTRTKLVAQILDVVLHGALA